MLLAVFWSSLDTPRARTALRNALYVLRQHLSAGVIRTRGDEEVSVDPALLTSDVATLESEVAAARFDEALTRYEGDVLPGLHIADAEGLEGWLDEERARVRRLVSAAGFGLAEAREHAGDLAGAAAPGWSPPLWLRVAAASGLAVSLLYSVLSIFPIIDVPSWWIFAAKVSGVVIGSNLLGAGLYAVARRRTALVPASVPGDG